MMHSSLKDILSNTTIHGLPNILFGKRLITRLIWLVFTLFAASVCITLIVSSVKSFLKNDVVTRIEEWPKNPFDFPTISFCNQNQPKTNYSLVDIMFTCMFDGKECSSNYFTKYYDLNFGLCYRFNENGTFQVKRPGKVNSFQIDLFTGLVYDYIPLGTTSNGIHVYIHNHTYMPSINEGYDVSTGLKTNIIIKQTFTQRLSSPYNDCEDNPKYFKSKIFDGIDEIGYRQRDCFDLKFLEYFSQQCNYSGNILEIIKTFRTRLSKLDFDAFKCLTDTNAFFYSQNIADLYTPDCPRECKSVNYAATITMSRYPSYALYDDFAQNERFLKLFKGNFTIEQFRESVVSFLVYYEDLKYTEITQDAKTSIIDLISNIGGLLGLFLGMSFLSLIEIVEFIIEFIFITCEFNLSNTNFKI